MSETWSPNLKDRYEKPGEGEIIDFLSKIFKYSIRGQLSDKDGIYAFLLSDEVLVGKDYVYGNIVSCHTDALETAEEQGKALVMYIRKQDEFYYFNPDEIMNNYEGFNMKNGREMVNFKIGLGQSVEVTEIGQ